MIEDGTEARVEMPTTAAAELVRRRRQIIVAHNVRHRAERPQCSLQARHERFEGLTRRQLRVRPAAEAQYPFEPQVLERLTRNRDQQIGGVREVEGGLTPGTAVCSKDSWSAPCRARQSRTRRCRERNWPGRNGSG